MMEREKSMIDLTSLNIRKAEEYDYPACHELYHEAFPSNERHPDSWKPSRMRIIYKIGVLSKPIITKVDGNTKCFSFNLA